MLLTAHRHKTKSPSLQLKHRGKEWRGVGGEKKKRSVIYFLQTLNRKYLPQQLQNLIFSFCAAEKLDKYAHSCPGVEELKGAFYFLRFSNQKLFQGAYKSEQLHRHQEQKYKPAGSVCVGGDAVKRNLKIMTKKGENWLKCTIRWEKEAKIGRSLQRRSLTAREKSVTHLQYASGNTSITAIRMSHTGSHWWLMRSDRLQKIQSISCHDYPDTILTNNHQ